MKIIGVDPGTIITGYGIVEYNKKEIIFIDAGIIKTPAVKALAPRIEKIYDELDRLIKTYAPDEFAIETAFYGKNIQSTMKIGYARGVAMLAAVHNKINIAEYSPREIKKSVVGKGAASKEQVQFMMNKLMQISKLKMKFDESDALAVAVCHAFKSSSASHSNGSWEKFVKANPDKIII
jgi:crossover junction endodeoxyribonuclease RuvC